MADNSILSQNIYRGLNDKLYEKRKQAALDVEKLVRDNIQNPEKVQTVINTLVDDFAFSTTSNGKNGGLIGLAAATIALGAKVGPYMDSILPPVLACFADHDSRVRYYACESMYNIAKVAKGEILRFFNVLFDHLCKLSADPEISVKNGAELLDRLIKDIVSEESTTYVSPFSPPLNPSEDENAERLMEIPTSLPRNTAFSLIRFIPLLSERIHTHNPFTRQYLVAWIMTLDSIPDLELVSFLPEFLDGLFLFLSDANEDVRVSTAKALDGFLRDIREAAEAREQHMKKYLTEQRQVQLQKEILETGSVTEGATSSLTSDNVNTGRKNSTSGNVENGIVDIDVSAVETRESEGQGKGDWIPGQGVIVKYARIVEILMPHLSSKDKEMQQTALKWLNAFIPLAKETVIQFTPQLIPAILPSLAHIVHSIRLIAIECNNNLMNLIRETPLNQGQPIISISNSSNSTSGGAQTQTPPSYEAHIPRSPTKASFLPPTQSFGVSPLETKSTSSQNTASNLFTDPFDYQATVNALTLQFLNEHEQTRIASLDWLLMLQKEAPNKILASDTFPVLLKTLSDPSDDVVKRDLQLLANISEYSDDKYFTKFMGDLLSLFSTDRRLLETRGSLIIRQLCMNLKPERIYRRLAETLEKDEDIEFASIMVQNLSIILITSPELAELRKRLKNLETKEDQILFTALYKSWCHSPVSTFSLCLLAQAYEHAANLIQIFAELDITVSFLIQIDKLVQLLESPVFTYLRLQLLEPEKHPYLFKCLYGILMLLPQSSAFATLRNRLNSVSSLGFLHIMPKTNAPSPIADKRPVAKTGRDDGIKFQELLSHFRQVQEDHEPRRKQSISHNLSTSNRRPGRKSERNSIGGQTTGSKIPSTPVLDRRGSDAGGQLGTGRDDGRSPSPAVRANAARMSSQGRIRPPPTPPSRQ